MGFVKNDKSVTCGFLGLESVSDSFETIARSDSYILRWSSTEQLGTHVTDTTIPAQLLKCYEHSIGQL
jgi:hypothetical protein